jgi:hypothetical protein
MLIIKLEIKEENRLIKGLMGKSAKIKGLRGKRLI